MPTAQREYHLRLEYETEKAILYVHPDKDDPHLVWLPKFGIHVRVCLNSDYHRVKMSFRLAKEKGLIGFEEESKIIQWRFHRGAAPRR